MKKYIYIFISIVLLGMTNHSCVDDFSNVNRDPNKLYNDNLPPEMLFPGIVYKTLNCMAQLNYKYYCWQSNYIRMNKLVKDQDDPNDDFYNIYKNVLKDLKLLEDNYAGKEGYENVGNIILVWKAYVYSVLSSTWGSVPMREAIMETADGQFHYDTEVDINREVVKLLGNAVQQFNPNGDKLTVDPFFPSGDGSSDIEKWRKFANTLRLDVAMRMMNMEKSPEAVRDAKRHIEIALNSVNKDYLISSVGDIAKGRWGTDVNADVSYYYRQILKGFEDNTTSSYSQYPAIHQYLFLYLKSFNDPRLVKYAQASTRVGNTDYRVKVSDVLVVDGASKTVTYRIPYLIRRDDPQQPLGHSVTKLPNSTESQPNPYEGLNPDEGLGYAYINRDFLRKDATFCIINWADACFMQAEVQLRKDEWGVNVSLDKAAQDYYYDGIRASMEEYGLDEKYSEYVAQNGIKWGTNSTKDGAGGEQIGLCEYRGYFRAFIYGKDGQTNCTRIPTNLPVPVQDYSYDPNPENYIGNYPGREKITGGLEQVWKQRYLADFWNGHAAVVLEHRTRIMNFPPIFYANNDNEGSYGSAGYYQCDYAPERQILPLWERNYNRYCYMEGCQQIQHASRKPNAARGGDNFYTPLAMAAPYYALSVADDALKVWENFQIYYHYDLAMKYYGDAINEKFYDNVRRYYPQCPSTMAGLKDFIDLEVQN